MLEQFVLDLDKQLFFVDLNRQKIETNFFLFCKNILELIRIESQTIFCQTLWR